MILNIALSMLFVWSTQNLFLIYWATQHSVTETDASVCHEISRLTGEGFMYLTIREIITIRSNFYNNNTVTVYSQCTSFLQFLKRS